jgi:hypothetical protein
MKQRCIDLLFADTLLFITREQFEQSLDGWTLDPVCRTDGSIGLIFVSKGPEFHFAKFGADIQASRDILKKYPGELIAAHGYALTKTPKTDARQLRFNTRLGFYQTGEDEFYIHLRIDHLRAKETPCQS